MKKKRAGNIFFCGLSGQSCLIHPSVVTFFQKAMKKGENFKPTDGMATIVYKILHNEKQVTDHIAAEDWSRSIWPTFLQNYFPKNIYNADETWLYYSVILNRAMVFKNNKSGGGKSWKAGWQFYWPALWQAVTKRNLSWWLERSIFQDVSREWSIYGRTTCMDDNDSVWRVPSHPVCCTEREKKARFGFG